LDPAGAIEAVLREDESADYRQLGAVDAAGRVSSHTGRSCIAHAGARSGESFSCQANMMACEGVPDAMADGYSSHGGDLAGRLLAGQDASAGAELYRQISELAPDSDELTFWAGVGVGAQDLDIGAELIERAASRNPSWLELLGRLPSELAPAAASLRAAIAARA